MHGYCRTCIPVLLSQRSRYFPEPGIREHSFVYHTKIDKSEAVAVSEKILSITMLLSPPQIYEDIDWPLLRANAMQKKGWKNKGPEQWDKKAGSFAKRNRDSLYTSLFLAQLPLQKSHTVLDIGCGPGTLALPIAVHVKSVTALDFSSRMLSTLDDLAKKENITNICSVQCSWEDNWKEKGIEPHDIAIASRSMGVEDLPAALEKIDQFGKRFVFLSDRIGATPFDEQAFKALGRDFLPGPDYIYTLNILYTLGIHANMTVLTLDRTVTYDNMDSAVSSYSWMFNDISATELKLLKKYISSRIIEKNGEKITVERENPPRWALIWWAK
jgi:SAM-dependent methyltransferase